MVHVRAFFAYLAALSIGLLFAATATAAPTRVRILFLGPERDPGFAAIQAAAVASTANSGRKPALLVRSLWQAFPESFASELVSSPAEHVAQLMRKHWPGDDVFVIAPDAARVAGTSGLTAALSAIVHASQSQRRILWRQNRGVLFGAHGTGLPSGRTPPVIQPTSLALKDSSRAVAAAVQAVTFGVDSHECATLSRNGVTFDQVCGFGPGRGINIAVINQITGEIEEIYDFDTWIDATRAAQYAEQFIAQILPERLVLIAVADANYLDDIPAAVAAFQQRFGSVCVAQVDFRDSWAAISQNTKLILEQCHKYSTTGDWVDSSVQYSLQLTPSSDTTPPTGTFRINSGASSANSNLVTLDFTGITDTQSGLLPGGKVRLSNDGTNWGPMLDFSASQNWILDRGSGLKTVYAQFRDRAGNWTDTQKATITLKEDTPLRPGPSSVGFWFDVQYCAVGTTILALSNSGDVAISPDLGSDWAKPQTILPSPNDYGWDQIFLNCSASGTVLAAGFSQDEKGNLLISTNSSSDSGKSWKPSATSKSYAFGFSDADYDYPQLAGVCSASPTNLVVFVEALLGQNDQIFALATQNAGASWPPAPVQLTNISGSAYLDSTSLQTACSKSAVVAAINGTNGVSIYRSINGGGAFATPNNPVAQESYDFHLVGDPNGALLLLTSNYSGYGLTARSSPDGGATWALPVAVAQPLLSPNYYASYYNLQAVSPDPGLFYVAWPEQISADGTEAVRVTVSKDGGSTWSVPTSAVAKNYWYSFMLAEKPEPDSFELAANATGDVELIWLDDRGGLGYIVQRFGIAADARSTHEDTDIQGITDLYAATSTDFGTTWKIAGPLQPNDVNGTGYLDGLSLSLASDGTAIAIWGGDDNTYLDVRFLNGSSLPLVDPGGPLNAASLMSGSLAPGSMAIISGQNLAKSAASGPPPALPANLSDASINITDSSGTTSLAGLYNVAPNQIRFVVPEGAAHGSAQMQITTSRGSLSVPISIAGVAPGIFSTTGDGTGTVLGWTVQTLADGSQGTPTSAGTPITFGPNTVSVQLTVLATGVHHASNIKLMIGGVPADQVAVSMNTDYPGMDQVSGLVSKSLSGAGTVSVYVVADSVSSNSLNLTFK